MVKARSAGRRHGPMRWLGVCALVVALASCSGISGESAEPPAASGPSPSEGFVQVRPSGNRTEPPTDIAYRDYGGQGRPIVLLTGLGDTAGVFDQLGPLLRDQGHRVVALTRRGYGASSKPGTGYDLATRTQDDAAAITALRLDRPVVVGHSIAGDELIGLATEHPERIAGIVSLDAMLDRSGGGEFEAAQACGGALLESGPAAPAPDPKDPYGSMQAYLRGAVRVPPGQWDRQRTRPVVLDRRRTRRHRRSRGSPPDPGWGDRAPARVRGDGRPRAGDLLDEHGRVGVPVAERRGPRVWPVSTGDPMQPAECRSAQHQRRAAGTPANRGRRSRSGTARTTTCTCNGRIGRLLRSAIGSPPRSDSPTASSVCAKRGARLSAASAAATPAGADGGRTRLRTTACACSRSGGTTEHHLRMASTRQVRSPSTQCGWPPHWCRGSMVARMV